MQNTKIKKKTLKLTAEKKIPAVRGIADCNGHDSRSQRLCKSILRVLRRNSFPLRVIYATKLFLEWWQNILSNKDFADGCVLEEVKPRRKEG